MQQLIQFLKEMQRFQTAEFIL